MKSHSREVLQIMDTLNHLEIRLLSSYLCDGRRQTEIAKAERIPQTSVSFRIRKAVAKLSLHGVSVHLPGRGRRSQARVVLVDPKAIERLSVGEDARASWTDGRKIDRDHFA